MSHSGKPPEKPDTKYNASIQAAACKLIQKRSPLKVNPPAAWIDDEKQINERNEANPDEAHQTALNRNRMRTTKKASDLPDATPDTSPQTKGPKR
jgi:hypothetical protein